MEALFNFRELPAEVNPVVAIAAFSAALFLGLWLYAFYVESSSQGAPVCGPRFPRRPS